MPEITIKIGPRSYNVACGEGEQEKVAALGELIAEQYARLGTARAARESQNLLFTALFMADELTDLRSRVEDAEAGADAKMASFRAEAQEAREALAKAQQNLREVEDTTAQSIETAVANAKADAAKDIERTLAKAEQEQVKNGGEKAELKAEIEILRKAEARAREEVQSLKAELEDLREANAKQHDLFVSPIDEASMATTLEALADKAEKAAAAMESSAKAAD